MGVIFVSCTSLSAGVFLVSTGATWKYLDDGSDQGTAWRARGFDDSAWLSGPAELGFEDGDEATPITRGYITYYFRHYFVVQNPADVTAMTVGFRRDDGGVVHLNGHQVFSSNMRPGETNYDSYAFFTTSETEFFQNGVDPEFLVGGTNVLAVEVHQSSPGSSDVSFDLWLSAEGDVNTNFSASVTLTSPANNSAVRVSTPVALAASASSTSSVESVNFLVAGSSVGSDAAAPYTVNWMTNRVGVYALQAIATFADGLSATSWPVSITIVSNLPPTAALTSPSPGSFFEAGSDIELLAQADDSDGTIDYVAILVDGGPFVEFFAPPYSFLWQGVPVGDYALQAYAFDNDGAEVTSPVVNIFVRENVPPSVSIVSPQNNAVVPLANVGITASAQDSDGAVSFVRFFVDNVSIGDDASPPYSRTVQNLSPGPHTLVAAAVDNSGATNFSAPVNVFASNAAASLLRGPYLQLCTKNAAVVRWRTDVNSVGTVWYGTDFAALTNIATDATATTEHHVHIGGLSPGTRYFYSVGQGMDVLASGPDHFFVTAPADSKPTRIWAIGDSGTGPGNAYNVRDAYLAHTGSRHTDVWLMLGDNAYGSGTDEQYQFAVFDTYPQLLRQVCLWPTIGNHDHAHGPRGYVYTDIFTLPASGEAGGLPSGNENYYSYDYGDIHFICLDSEFNDRSPTGPMLTWLGEDLAANTKLWTIAYFHHPPYTKGTHNSDTEGQLIEMRQNAAPILEAHGVDLVLTGHSHTYERSFLLSGHYGHSTTFQASMKVDAGSGRTNETGAYQKLVGQGGNGTVYAVVGCSGQVGGGSLNHPAKFISIGGVGGSLVVDIENGRLDARFLRFDGGIGDTFTILKAMDTPALTVVRAGGVARVSWPVTPITYSLEGTPNLNPPVSWVPVTDAVSQEDGRNVVLVPLSEEYQYFRLRR